MALHYAGIGSRETPDAILQRMVSVGTAMANRGWVLRSGAAKGADSAFEYGCDISRGQKEIFTPSNCTISAEAYALAEQLHPNWSACSDYARKLHARNGYQILGLDLRTPVSFVICWTKGARGQGGTGQALRIAKLCGIPVFDFGAFSDSFFRDVEKHILGAEAQAAA